MSLQNVMWRGEAGRLELARSAAHSTMLSAYISVMSTDGFGVKFATLGLWHAGILLWHWRSLSHDQLDVLIQFLLKIRSSIPFVKSGRPLQGRLVIKPGLFLLRLARHGVCLAEDAGAKPHQRALAHMTLAEVIYAVNFNSGDIEGAIDRALSLSRAIQQEPSQPLGLRQLVRIRRKAGELYSTSELWSVSEARLCLEGAFKLAEGEADALSQVPRIRALLKKIS